MDIIASEGLIYAFNQSNYAGKAIIFLLVAASVLSWSLMFIKFRYVNKVAKANRLFLKNYRRSKHPIEIYAKQKSFLPSSMFSIYESAAKEISFHLIGDKKVGGDYLEKLLDADTVHASSIASVRSSMEQKVGEEMLKLEDHLILLATVVSGAPFLGLLGTVWGVMDAFSGVAASGSTTIAALAPGVSGALITTVIGLLVAIPAMFGYNVLISKVKKVTVEMENFSMECASDLEHHYLDKSR